MRWKCVYVVVLPSALHCRIYVKQIFGKIRVSNELGGIIHRYNPHHKYGLDYGTAAVADATRTRFILLLFYIVYRTCARGPQSVNAVNAIPGSTAATWRGGGRLWMSTYRYNGYVLLYDGKNTACTHADTQNNITQQKSEKRLEINTRGRILYIICIMRTHIYIYIILLWYEKTNR